MQNKSDTTVVLPADEVQKAPEPPKDLRSAAQIAQTNHLRSAKVPEDDAAAGEVPDVTGLVVPDDIIGCHAALQVILAERAYDAFGEKVKRAKLAKLRAKLSELEQGPPTPVIPPAAYRAASSLIRNPHRLSQLAGDHPELAPIISRMGISQSDLAPLPKIRFTGREEKFWPRVREEVQEPAQAFLETAEGQQKKFDELSTASLFPGQAQEDAQILEHGLPSSCETVAELKAVSAIVAALRAIPATIQREAARRSNGHFVKLAEPLAALCSAARASLEIIRGELLKAEQEFFDKHGVGSEVTRVSGVVEQMLARISRVETEFGIQQKALSENPSRSAWPRADIASVSFLFE